MSAGRLAERLVVQTVTDTTDALGGKTETVATLTTIPAELVPMTQAERFQAQRIGAQQDYRFRVRSRAGLTTKQRLSWTPRWPNGAAAVSLEVHGVTPDPDRKYLVLDCGVFA
jgi:SPP1 family predicted phage head-tail adaptor